MAKYIYPKLETDWCPRVHGNSRCLGVRFPNETIFYSKRKDGLKKFAYVKDGELLDSNGNVSKNGVELLRELVDGYNTWTCGQLFIILPDTKEHVYADDYRSGFSAR